MSKAKGLQEYFPLNERESQTGNRLPFANWRNWVYCSGTVIIESREYEGKELTGEQMHKMARGHWADLGSFLAWPFDAWFDFVRLIPYESDEEKFPERPIELVPRPAYLLDRTLFPRIDCKKKSVLVSAWAYAHGYPYRFVAVSSRPDGLVHHVFPQIDFGNGWVNADATFAEFSIGQAHPVTFAAELMP